MKRSILKNAGLWASLSLLAACGGPPPEVEPPPPPPTGEVDAGTSAPTYHQDVAPILAANCVGCHASGGIGHFSLETAAAVTPMAGAIAAATRSGQMPPWPAKGKSPTMHHERKLTQAELDTLQAWALGGAKVGDPATAAALPDPELVEIGTPERDVDIGADYQADGTLHDDYRCFLVDLAMTEPRMATGYRVTPTNPGVVHHVLVYLYTADDVAELQTLDAQDDLPGWGCLSGPTPSGSSAQSADMLGGWAPGNSTVRITPGVGVLLQTGMVAVVQVHYHLGHNHSHSGGPTVVDPDRTRVEIALATPAEAADLQQQITLPVAKLDLRIPADDPNYAAVLEGPVTDLSGGAFFPDGNAYVVGVMGHMHLLGTRFELSLTDPDGTEKTLLDIPDWDFNWQYLYQLVEPIRFGPNDTVRLACHYDNSPSNRAVNEFEEASAEVTWGEGTFDEMCLGYVMLTDDPPLP